MTVLLFLPMVVAPLWLKTVINVNPGASPPLLRAKGPAQLCCLEKGLRPSPCREMLLTEPAGCRAIPASPRLAGTALMLPHRDRSTDAAASQHTAAWS